MLTESSPIREMFEAAVTAVSGQTATQSALLGNLQEGDLPEQVYLIAVGKAAGGMTKGALEALGSRLIKGLVISKYDHLDQALRSDQRLHCLESAHPVPDRNSELAGAALLDFARSLPADAEVLFLLSGGASALIEVLPEGVSLDDLQRLSQELLSTGLDINQMNQVRRQLSLIKGGRLALALSGCHTQQLLISDVPGDAPESIGSGPLIPSHAAPVLPALPEWVDTLLRAAPAPPPLNHPVWQRIETRIVASNAIACRAAVAAAHDLGLPVVQSDGVLTGDVVAMAASICAVLSAPETPSGVYIWGGETTVVLPANPGRGGRNQQLALELVLQMQTRRTSSGCRGWQALCCGTDGTDGPTPDAGGLVNHTTYRAGQDLGLDARDHARRADAGEYLRQTGALVTTGPTGTNVMDLVIVVLEP